MKNAYFGIMAIPVIIGVLVVAYMVQEPQESDVITTTALLSDASPIFLVMLDFISCEFCTNNHQNTSLALKSKICRFWISVNIVFGILHL